ncbi:MAG: terpene cyclase/mutase family protein [Planctomycetaceae bacterium]|jgi:hypothetical protein|nr:terpene cyclase/mutase family protein [Planctomycetaceae bacterium]
MSRIGDVLYFLCQIFFPNWIDREDDAEPTRFQKWLVAFLLFLTSRNGTGAAFSIVLHIFILVILALKTFPHLSGFTGIDILGDFRFPGKEQTAFVDTSTDPDESNDDGELQNTEPAVQEIITVSPTLPDVKPSVESPENTHSDQRLQLQAIGGFVSGGGFQNRNPASRQRAMQGGGSTQGSEAAIESALRWLAAHQQSDGGWSLHFADSCQLCSHSGTSPTSRRTAATALALLSFLGAGYSHQTSSPYQTNVERGLRFLILDVNGGFEGEAILRDDLRMYSYGLAAMALCEAYAMNKAPAPTTTLGIKAQKSLSLIEEAQDADYGGWNYRAGQINRREDGRDVRIGGDTSIFAWQLMALKSGKIGGLNVSQSSLYAAHDFLDLVALDGGRNYQYIQTGGWDSRGRGEDSAKTCTAIGLLMRMYLGWKPGNPFLDDGMEQLANWGPMPRAGECNLYYAYYATLALHHYGGEHWDSWNNELQTFLIRTQSREMNDESGSWYFPDSYCDHGGRLLNTALAVMILETPYRYMPLYRELR